jgi:LCP family protein required for cell wall assembly
LAVILAGIALCAGTRAYYFYTQPLGPALNLPTRIVPTRSPSASPAAPGVSSEPSPTLTSTPAAACGGPPVMNILLIGSDSRANQYFYGLSDVMRIMRVDFVAQRVTVLEIPRDLWVEIPDISEHYGITHGKLNQAYLYGNPGLGYYTGKGQGPELLAKTLDLNFSIHPDHYVAVNMLTFSAIVDELGGLDIYLPYDVDARTTEEPNAPSFSAGSHHMDGQTALMLARIRQYNVFGRADNQNIVMCAIRKKLLNPGVVPHIPEFVDTFKRYVQTDFSPEQINQLACLAPRIEGRNIVFISFPEKLFTRSRMYDPTLKKEVFIFDVDFNVLRDYIAKFDEGSWPPKKEDLATAPVVSGSTEQYTCP